MTTSVEFQLPENLTIASVSALHDELEELMSCKECETVSLIASAVERVDTAGLQLLAVFVKSATERKIAVQWGEPSEKLKQSAALLDLNRAMGMN